jgi:ATP-dependent helicase Lhr and Lhr-like helicase
VLGAVHAGQVQLVSRDTPEPSAFADEVLNAAPYAFVDDAPLEERRTHAVHMRRPVNPDGAEPGLLDAAAIERVVDEMRPDPRDAEELHDALVTTGFLMAGETDAEMVGELTGRGRATRIRMSPERSVWVAAERLPEFLTVHPAAAIDPPIAAPESRAARVWSRDEALVSLFRGRMAILGPVSAAALAESIGVSTEDANAALLALESDGVVLRGVFTPEARIMEWCDRALLARIHRYTLNRLRAEIAPVTPAEFMRFLFAWQHVDPSTALTGPDGLRAIIAQLDGVEVPARAWEREVLPSRVEGYEPALLDMLCLTGEVSWARLSSGPTQVVGATPIALYLREHAEAWLTLRQPELLAVEAESLANHAVRILDRLRSHGAAFAHDLGSACAVPLEDVHRALAELVASGCASSDGAAGLRRVIGATPWATGAHRAGPDGRWFALQESGEVPREAAVETLAWTLLQRYGVVFRRVLAREAAGVPWRELAHVYRRLEARGDIRGGRFVSGMAGEQFALPDAVERLREIRRSGRDDRLLTISAADPLNLTGIITPGDRIRTTQGSRIVYRNGVPIAAMEGDMLKRLADVDPVTEAEAAAAAAGRRVTVVSGYVGRRLHRNSVRSTHVAN